MPRPDPAGINLSLTLLGLSLYSAVIVYLVFFSKFDLFDAPDSVIQITNAQRLLGYSEHPPALCDPRWEDVTLPDDWRNQSLEHSDAWYRFQIPQQRATSTLLGVYIPTIRQNAAVYVNGQWIGQGGPFDQTYTRVWHQPQLYRFAEQMLTPDNNIVELRVSSHRLSSVYLSNVYLGEQDALVQAWRWRTFLKVDLLSFIAHFFIIIGALNFTMWALRRHETFYLWYALAATVWGARCYLLLPETNFISHDLWAALRLTTLGWGVVFVLLFNLRFFGQRDRVVDWLLFLYCVPLAVPMFFMSVETLHGYGHQFWARMCIVIAAYCSYKLIAIYKESGDFRSIMLLCTGIPLFIFGVYDLLVLNDHISPKNGFIINFASPPALILAMWFMFQRFSQSLDDAEQLNITLDKRVNEKEQQLEQQYAQQEELQRRQVLTEERERIMRDMHDGLGGHLVALKALTDSGDDGSNLKRAREHIARALVDLRFVVNSLDGSTKDVTTLLGSMRKRWQQICDSKSIKLQWFSAEPTEQLLLRPRRMLQTLRILEEAFSNSIQHSGATQITVHYAQHNAHTIQIIDNGQNSWQESGGKGVPNMHYRAQLIDAGLRIDKNESGCTVTLKL